MERLIESVHKRPCLWKCDSIEYKQTDLKNAAWEEVIKECDLHDAQEARNVWKSLRDGHRQSITRKKATSKTSWKYEKHMKFLIPYMQTRPKLTNVIVLEGFQQNSNSSDTAMKNETHLNEENSDNVEDQSYPYGDLLVVPSKKKVTIVGKRTIKQRPKIGRALEKRSLHSSSMQDSVIKNFFTSMMLTTQSLPETLQLKIQRQVFNTVMDAKQEYLASNASSSTTVYLRGDTPFEIHGAGPSRSASPLSNSSSSSTF